MTESEKMIYAAAFSKTLVDQLKLTHTIKLNRVEARTASARWGAICVKHFRALSKDALSEVTGDVDVSQMLEEMRNDG